MSLPQIRLGLVVCYEYLWHRRSSADTADKDHPACIVVTFKKDGRPEDFVVYLPISHSPPADGDVGIELSTQAKKEAGLDSRPQWILISECNVDTWPIDLRQVPGSDVVRFHYGYLPRDVFALIVQRFGEMLKARRLKQVKRFTDTPKL